MSPLKAVIESDYMKSIISAKRSAALKSCIQLHKLGEFTDQLIPASPDMIMQDLNYLFPNWLNEDDSLRGTYKKKRKHELKVRIHISYSIYKMHWWVHFNRTIEYLDNRGLRRKMFQKRVVWFRLCSNLALTG